MLDANGSGSDASVIAAIDRAIELKSTYDIRVMNLSLGRQIRESFTLDPLCQAVERAWHAGIVVVVAAGNRGRDNSMGTKGYGTIGAPGNSPWVITVGAMKDNNSNSRADDRMATFSSKGPTLVDNIVKPDLVAPGNRIVSAWATANTLSMVNPANVVTASNYRTGGSLLTGSYLRLSGTSMAAPVVAGAAALILQRDPAATPDTVKARLMRTASKAGLPSSEITTDATGATFTVNYDLFTIGAGYVDIWAALNSNEHAGTKRALSPRAVFNTTNNTVTVSYGTVAGVNVLWGDSLWPSNVVWGDSVLSGNNVLWGDNVVWGDSTQSAFNVLWGDNVVWGDSTFFPESLSFTGDSN